MPFKSAAQRGAYYEALKARNGSNSFGATPAQHNAAIVSSPLLPSNTLPKMIQPVMRSPSFMGNAPVNPSMPINPAGANKFNKIKKLI